MPKNDTATEYGILGSWPSIVSFLEWGKKGFLKEISDSEVYHCSVRHSLWKNWISNSLEKLYLRIHTEPAGSEREDTFPTKGQAKRKNSKPRQKQQVGNTLHLCKANPETDTCPPQTKLPPEEPCFWPRWSTWKQFTGLSWHLTS